MPSDAAKKRQQQKKEKKIAQDKKRIAEKQGDGKLPPTESDKENDKNPPPPPPVKGGATATVSSVGAQMKDLSVSARSCTGVLASHPDSRDVHIESLSVTLHGAELLCDAKLELNCGRRYGLLGLNGSGMCLVGHFMNTIIAISLLVGKSTLLSALGNREFPVPAHIDIYHLKEEIPSSDKTPLQCVVEVDEER